MASWIRIRIRIRSSWIRIRIQEKRDGFGFSWIRIRGVWIRIRIRIRDAWIRTSLIHAPCMACTQDLDQETRSRTLTLF